MTLVWFLIAGLLVIIETQTLEFTCLSLALGCVVGGTLSALGAPFAAQTIAAAVVAALSVYAGAPWLRARLTPKDTPTASDAYVGQVAEVIEAISPPAEGKARLNGVTWQAVADEPLPVGTRAEILAVSGAKLHLGAVQA